MAYRVGVTGADLNPTLSNDLTATTYLAVIHFKDLGNILVKARNFERHSPPLDYEKVIASIAYHADKGMYRGPDPNSRGSNLLEQMLLRAAFLTDVSSRTAEVAANTAAASTPKCFKCSATCTPDGETLLTCSQCKQAKYCSTRCQKLDWKRHKVAKCKLKTQAPASNGP